MMIYFSCSITGGRQDEQVYTALVEEMLAGGHDVPTAILARPEVVALEAVTGPIEIFERDVAWVRDCDLLVAEVSTPSHGVGYEIALALTLNKPVLCLHAAGRRVSKMITGNTHPRIHRLEYSTTDEAVAGLRQYLQQAQSDWEKDHI